MSSSSKKLFQMLKEECCIVVSKKAKPSVDFLICIYLKVHNTSDIIREVLGIDQHIIFDDENQQLTFDYVLIVFIYFIWPGFGWKVICTQCTNYYQDSDQLSS